MTVPANTHTDTNAGPARRPVEGVAAGTGRASQGYLARADRLADAIDALFVAPVRDTPGQPAAALTDEQVVEQADLTGMLTRLSAGIAVHTRYGGPPAWAALADALALAADQCRHQIPPAERPPTEPPPIGPWPTKPPATDLVGESQAPHR